MPGHRAGVAEAQVDVLDPVDVGEPRALADSTKTGNDPASASSTASVRRPAALRALLLGEGGRPRVLGDEAGLLVLAERGQPVAVDHGHGRNLGVLDSRFNLGGPTLVVRRREDAHDK